MTNEAKPSYQHASRPGRGSQCRGAVLSSGSGIPQGRLCHSRISGSCTSSPPRACQCAGCACGCSQHSLTCEVRSKRTKVKSMTCDRHDMSYRSREPGTILSVRLMRQQDLSVTRPAALVILVPMSVLVFYLSDSFL